MLRADEQQSEKGVGAPALPQGTAEVVENRRGSGSHWRRWSKGVQMEQNSSWEAV